LDSVKRDQFGGSRHTNGSERPLKAIKDGNADTPDSDLIFLIIEGVALLSDLRQFPF
jgi:hypothetical protein